MGTTNIERGTFIVLEGADGSGKGTQFRLLADQLREAGHAVETFDFPQYQQPSSYFIQRYLAGDYGTANEVGPYTGALFYALDRYDIAGKIREAIASGKIVLANRYSGSSMAHQGAKFSTAEQQRDYFLWLDNLEFETLKIPRPDLNIVLRVPAEVSQRLLKQRDEQTNSGKKPDIHEADIEHLRHAVTTYDDLCRLFPQAFTRIDCVRGGELLSVATINKLIAEKVAPLLPEPKSKPKQGSGEQVDTKSAAKTLKSDFYIPPTIADKTLRFYNDSVNELRNRHGRLVSALATHLRQDTSLSEADARKQASVILRAVLPVAYLNGAPIQKANPAVRSLLEGLMKHSHAASTDDIAILVSAYPRNEFDSIPAFLYGQSNVPLKELIPAADNWNYEQKAEILALFLNDGTPAENSQPTGLNSISYTWDITSPYQLFAQLFATGIGRAYSWQTLTPRLGFAIPKAVDDAGLTDQFEESFDVSLRFHSQLQQKGFDNEAQQATLLGHKLRWSVTYTASEQAKIMAILRSMDMDLTGPLLTAMTTKLAETHPLVGASLLSLKV